MSPYDATIDLHDSYYASVAELRRRSVADRLRIAHGDCLEIIPRLVAEGILVDAVVCDPPYHLRATIQTFGNPQSAFRKSIAETEEKRGSSAGAAARLSRGFMGQQWDGGDVAFRPETWATVGSIMRPGGFLVAFGGTRTYHRLVCAIEDAGFVIQDQLAWLFGGGFPKHRSQLKPAHEPICLAYKPGAPRTLGVDECRVHVADSVGRVRHGGGIAGTWQGFSVSTAADKHGLPDGRWPANVVHDGSAEVLAGFPTSSSTGTAGTGASDIYGKFERRARGYEIGFGDSGSAARFFYAAKADAADRWGSRHPTVKPIDLIRWLVTLVTPPGGTFLDPFAGSGTAAVAALASGRDAILIEREAAYVADIRERIAHYAGEGRHSLVAKGRGRADRTTGTLL